MNKTDTEILDQWAADYQKDPLTRYEDAAAEFYRDTGMMAPGKSEPMDFAGLHDPQERRDRWDEWSRALGDARMAAVARLRTDLARLRDTLAAERGERGPEGWTYEGGSWRRELDDDDHELRVRREEPRWDPPEWRACEYAGGRVHRNLGPHPTALDAMEAADRAATTTTEVPQ